MNALNRISDIPPRRAARVAGFLYLLIFIAAPSGAKTATPLKLTVTLACDVGVALLLYYLFRPVSTRLALLAALFRLVFVIVMTVNSVNYFGLLSLVAVSRSPSSFDLIYGLSLVPFGLSCILLGYVVYGSSFLPRWLGVLMAVAGAGYMTFLWPPLAQRIFFPWLAITGVLGEGR